MRYDSEPTIREHIKTVRGVLLQVIGDLEYRAEVHDASKLEEPEKSILDELTLEIDATEYMSEEYVEIDKKMAKGRRHHYETNSHHPEYFENGINGMSLLDLIEMLADWKAATLRHDSDINRSLEINKSRYGMSDQLYSILKNTIEEMGW